MSADVLIKDEPLDFDCSTHLIPLPGAVSTDVKDEHDGLVKTEVRQFLRLFIKKCLLLNHFFDKLCI